MVEELYGQKSSAKDKEVFRREITKFARWARKRITKKGELSREDIYKGWFVKGKDIADGGYRRKLGYKHLSKVKKLVDLKYNSAIPDLIERFTFTPYGEPTRSALQDQIRIGEPADTFNTFLESILGGEFCDMFIEEMQRRMWLPNLDELTFADVVNIRSTSEWLAFVNAQKRIIDQAVNGKLPLVPNSFSQYQKNYFQLQQCISELLRGRIADKVEERFQPFATLAIGFVGKWAVFGFGQAGGGALNPAFLAGLEASLESLRPRLVHDANSIAIKLCLNVWDWKLRQFDPMKSHNIEFVKSGQIFTAKDIEDMLHTAENQPGFCTLPHSAEAEN